MAELNQQEITELTIPEVFKIGVDIPFPLNGKATSGIRLQYESLTPELCEITPSNICKVKAPGDIRIKVTAPAIADQFEVAEIEKTINAIEGDFTESANGYLQLERNLAADISILNQIAPVAIKEIKSVTFTAQGQAAVKVERSEGSELGGRISTAEINKQILNQAIRIAEEYMMILAEDLAIKKARIENGNLQ